MIKLTNKTGLKRKKAIMKRLASFKKILITFVKKLMDVNVGNTNGLNTMLGYRNVQK